MFFIFFRMVNLLLPTKDMNTLEQQMINDYHKNRFKVLGLAIGVILALSGVIWAVTSATMYFIDCITK